MLDGLAAQTRRPDLVLVVDNASTDETRAVLEARTDLPLEALHLDENTGGAGGFHTGLEGRPRAGLRPVLADGRRRGARRRTASRC